MPTVLYIRGWRLFFYANEGNEPPHIHARKGDVECKYWLRPDTFDIEEVMLTMPVPRIAAKFVKSFLPILIILSLSMRIFSNREVHNE